MDAEVSLRPAALSDAAWIAELRAVVMRPDLERLGRYDAQRVRRRFLDGYRPEHTRIIELDGEAVGSIAARVEDDAVWIEHFYLATAVQGRGIGSAVLARVMREEVRPTGPSASTCSRKRLRAGCTSATGSSGSGPRSGTTS
ncbi:MULTISPECIES: GNAT family N-acetyltransferase [unclassified Rathayibacter]|uniref:GNAT family N-acetyltransferase n=1 Tax=unclassified Rathayibacter TaxID=2609250 RepID=UPI000ADEECB4